MIASKVVDIIAIKTEMLVISSHGLIETNELDMIEIDIVKKLRY